ncbi:MAG TPA: hypothetical protein VEX66_07720 [Microlunatus sp.]|nr:hypothetical protein [Microlunatus sp.]
MINTTCSRRAPLASGMRRTFLRPVARELFRADRGRPGSDPRKARPAATWLRWVRVVVCFAEPDRLSPARARDVRAVVVVASERSGRRLAG